MSTFRSQFRYPENLLFFNSGSMSLSPTAIVDAVQHEKLRFEDNPTDALFGAWARLWAIQKELAAYLKVRPQDMYLRQNVTYAMNDFIMALKLPKGSEILYSDLEYGAIVKQCQYKAEIEGLTTREFAIHSDLPSEKVTEDILLSSIERALSPKTSMVMLSHVMTGTGLKIPIEKIGRLLRSKNIFFVVDGAHGAGTEDLKIDASFLDFYGSNLHKWMMGPKGTGFGWIAPHMREHLQPKFAGWTTGVVPDYHQTFGNGDEWAMRWMICATVNFADFLGIPAMLRYWREQGAGKIYADHRAKLELTRTRVSAATGWKCLSQYPGALQTQLLAFDLPDAVLKIPDLAARLFAKKNIVVSTPYVRGKTILRLSPNIYNTEAEIDRLSLELKNVNNGGLL